MALPPPSYWTPAPRGAALSRSCDFSVTPPPPGGATRPLLPTEGAPVVSAEAPVLGQHRQEMTAVRLSGHICPAALLHPPPPPVHSENQF